MSPCVHPRHRPRPGGQRGVVLLFALISVLIVMLAAVALIKSFNATLFSAGNIAFKRSMQSESELAIQQVMAAFRTGALASATSRETSMPSANYSATLLTSVNNQNIPTALQNASSMTAAGFTKADITGSPGVTVRYVIERLCDNVGSVGTLGTLHCLTANPTQLGSQSKDQTGAGQNALSGSCGSGPCVTASSLGVVYRVSVRVLGPRNTSSFFQSTITAP